MTQGGGRQKKSKRKRDLKEDDSYRKLVNRLVISYFLSIFSSFPVCVWIYKMERWATLLINTLTKSRKKMPPELTCVFLVGSYGSELEKLWFYMPVGAAALLHNMVSGCPPPSANHFHQEWGKMDAFKFSSPFKRSFNESGRGCQASLSDCTVNQHL